MHYLVMHFSEVVVIGPRVPTVVRARQDAPQLAGRSPSMERWSFLPKIFILLVLSYRVSF